MLDLMLKTPPPSPPLTRQEHDWQPYAYAKEQSAFPSRRPHRLCRRCGVVCRPDTEFSPCNPEQKKDVKS